MPVSNLLVEGELDAQVLQEVLSTLSPRPSIIEGGSKYSLKHQVREKRKTTSTSYLRDRDFDYEPPTDRSQPTVDGKDTDKAIILGWRWCRHAIESYLLEPGLVARATEWAEVDYTAALMEAARHLLPYTAARWAVGTARRSLPPHHELQTRPRELNNEIQLPSDCSEESCFGWAREHLESYRQKVDGSLALHAVDTSLNERTQQLSALSGAADALVWYSGKDLLAALAPSIRIRFGKSLGAFLSILRNWVMNNPEQALQLFPEWQALLSFLSS